jgi:hypothetical protein
MHAVNKAYVRISHGKRLWLRYGSAIRGYIRAQRAFGMKPGKRRQTVQGLRTSPTEYERSQSRILLEALEEGQATRMV